MTNLDNRPAAAASSSCCSKSAARSSASSPRGREAPRNDRDRQDLLDAWQALDEAVAMLGTVSPFIAVPFAEDGGEAMRLSVLECRERLKAAAAKAKAAATESPSRRTFRRPTFPL